MRPTWVLGIVSWCCEMSRMKFKNDAVLYVLALLMVLPCLGAAQLNRNTQNELLIGIKGIQVEVNIGLSADGPSKQRILEQVEGQIREAGLQVLASLGEESQSFQPLLLFEVAILKRGSNPYVYFINASLFQPVQLVGRNSSVTLGATWKAALIGEGGLGYIQDDVGKLVSQFLNQHKRANSEKLHATIK